MYSALRGSVGIACIRFATFIPIHRKQLDEDRISSPLERDPDSGVDRVLSIFDRDEYGTLSPELSFINIFGFTGGMLGALYGGLFHARITSTRFRECNEATVFDSHRLAYRKLLDETALGFGKGAARYGIRYGIFCLSFAGLSTIIQKFRGEAGILEYTLGGLFTGSLYKFGLGPKGMVSGAFFGGLLGFFAGSTTYALTKIFDFKIDEVYATCKKYFEMKDLNFHGAFKTQSDEEDILIEVYYPDGMDSKKHSLDELEDIKSVSELKYNKNVLPKLNTDSKEIVNKPEKK